MRVNCLFIFYKESKTSFEMFKYFKSTLFLEAKSKKNGVIGTRNNFTDLYYIHSIFNIDLFCSLKTSKAKNDVIPITFGLFPFDQDHATIYLSTFQLMTFFKSPQLSNWVVKLTLHVAFRTRKSQKRIFLPSTNWTFYVKSISFRGIITF